MNEEDWKNSINERLVNLNTAQKNTDLQLEKMDEVLDALDTTIRGDLVGHDTSLLLRLGDVERSVKEFHSILLEDHAGEKGLCDKVDALISGKMDLMERRKSRSSVIIAIITSAALVLTNLDRIGEFWIKIFGKGNSTELEQKIDRAKHPHVRHVVPRRVIDYSEPVPPSESE